MFSRGLMESFKQGAAFGGGAVFLQAAVWFFGDGALDKVGGEGGIEIASFKVFASPNGQSSLNFLPGHFFSQDGRYSSQLFADLSGDLSGCLGMHTSSFLCHPTPLRG